MNGHFIVFVLSRNIWCTFFTAEPLVTWHTVLILLLPISWDGPLFSVSWPWHPLLKCRSREGFCHGPGSSQVTSFTLTALRRSPFSNDCVSLLCHYRHTLDTTCPPLTSSPDPLIPEASACLVSESTTEWKLVQALHAASNSDNVYHIPFFKCGHLTLKNSPVHSQFRYKKSEDSRPKNKTSKINF